MIIIRWIDDRNEGVNQFEFKSCWYNYLTGDKRSTSEIEHLNCDKLQIDRILCGNLFQRVAQMTCMVLRPDGPGRKGICSKKEI